MRSVVGGERVGDDNSCLGFRFCTIRARDNRGSYDGDDGRRTATAAVSLVVNGVAP